MPPNASKGFSLKHLPDLSDASVSFQIPADSSSAEFLLADNSDFLRGTGGASFATVAPTPARGLLNLSDVTPNEESHLLPPRSPSPVLSTQGCKDFRPLRFKRQSPIKAKKTARTPSSRLKGKAFDEPTISEERLHSLRAEMETLKEDYDITMHMEQPTVAQCSVITMPSNTATTRPTTRSKSVRAKHTMEDGHNVEHTSRSMIPVSADAKFPNTDPAAQSSSTWSQVPSASLDPENIQTLDTSPNARRGMGERLVFNDQRLMSSIGIHKPMSENSTTTDAGAVLAKTDVHVKTLPSPTAQIAHARSALIAQSSNGYPLRLSDISPQKREAENSASTGHLSAGRRELSPMRPASKRPATEDPPSHQHGDSKKGKPLSQRAVTNHSQSIPAGSSSQVLQPSIQRNHAHAIAPIGRDSRWPTSNFPSARTKYKPKLASHRKGPLESTTPRSSSSHGIKTISKEKSKYVVGREAVSTGRLLPSRSKVSGTFRVHSDEGKVDKKKPMILSERSGPSRAGLVSSIDNTDITLLPANLTKPVAFTFRVDSRIEARKEEKLAVSEQGHMESFHRHRHPIPDSKGVSLACRKLVPMMSGPPPIMLHTEIRAREREKFDEMMRMKEDVMEREKEERRRQQEAEEQREIKELRRRAIPKANEVPEWYAEMPKKAGGARGSG